jgi:hypothetical protein
MNKYIYIILVFPLLLIACKKKTIESLPQSNDPVFYLSGTLGGGDVNLVAGENGMSMNHGVESRNGVSYTFGELTNGNTYVKMGFFDGNLSTANELANLQVGDSLLMANKFSENLAMLFKGNFSNDANISNVDWYIDGLYKGANQVIITQPGLYNVCGNFTFVNGVQKSICNSMYLGFEQDVNFSIKHFLSENGDVKLWVEGETQYFDSVVWQIGNEFATTAGTYSTNIGNVVQSLSATVYRQNGAVRKKNVVIDGTFSGNYIEDFAVCEMPITQRRWDYTAGLETKINGEIYSSFEVANYKSHVIVKNIVLHEINANGDRVMRFTLDVDAMLKSATSGIIKAMKFEAVFAYPIPN